MFTDRALSYRFTGFLFALLCCSVQAAYRPENFGWNQYTLEGDLKSFQTVYFDNDKSNGRQKLFLGGVNNMYEFDPENVTHPPKELAWAPPQRLLKTCLTFNPDENLCQNSIRVFLPLNSSHLYACGTMAFNPRCIYVSKSNFTSEKSPEESGVWKTPPEPYVPTVSVIANNTLFTATRASAYNNDAIISRTLNGVIVRTKHQDKYWLNDPEFISGYYSRERDLEQGKIMLFFREKAEEFKPYSFGLSNNPYDRNVVSRVATVCLNDHGGTIYVLHRRFATYVKKTIVCNPPISDAGTTPFSYTHLVSTFEMPDIENPAKTTIYGIFTMPNDAIAGSAVCAFTKEHLENGMAENGYWRRTTGEEFGSVNTSYNGDPSTGPGLCVPETRNLTQTRLQFGDKHPVKFGTISPTKNSLFYQEPGTRFTHIVVDKVPSSWHGEEQEVTVLYMMTNQGLLKRVVFSPNNIKKHWNLPDVQIVELREREMILKMVLGDKYLYVVTNRTMVQMPLASCSLYESCNQCLVSRDPYCIVTYAGSCDPVYEYSSSEKRVLMEANLSCPAKSPPVNLERELIEGLQENVTLLIDRNIESEQRLNSVMREKKQLQDELSSCSAMYEAANTEAVKLRRNLTHATEELYQAQNSGGKTDEDLQKCRRTQKFFMDHALRITLQLRKRPTREECEKQKNLLKQGQDAALMELSRCREEQSRQYRKTVLCSETKKRADERMFEANQTCYDELARAKEEYNLKIQNLQKVMETLTKSVRPPRETKNNHFRMTEKKLRICYDQIESLKSVNSILQKETKNMSLTADNFRREKNRYAWLFKKFRNQQVCVNGDKWYLSNATGSLFLLVDKRATFNAAENYCRHYNASLAIFRNNEELRYITSLLRTFEPKRHYWIGLVKSSNGTIRWRDGSTVRKFQSRVSTERMSSKITYCAEVSGAVKWDLIPCSQHRRFICQRDRKPSLKPFTQTPRF